MNNAVLITLNNAVLIGGQDPGIFSGREKIFEMPEDGMFFQKIFYIMMGKRSISIAEQEPISMVIPHYCEEYNPDNFVKPEAFLIVSVQLDEKKGRGSYNEYISKVRPIVQRFGGEYLLRSEKITPLGSGWSPNRIIVIRFPDRESLDRCFVSPEYQAIMNLRTESVNAQAVIAEEW